MILKEMIMPGNLNFSLSFLLLLVSAIINAHETSKCQNDEGSNAESENGNLDFRIL